MARRALPQIALDRILTLRRRTEARRAREQTAAEHPELIQAYQAFARGRQSGSPRQPFKGWDLWRILETVRPRSIAELGSGTTSAVFALYAREYDADYVGFEHHPDWCGVTLECLRAAGIIGTDAGPVREVAMREDEAGETAGFVEDLPLDVDFVYVDGPPCPVRQGKKWANDDVVRLFDRGGRPRCVVVDGRIDTVDLIARHAASVDYELRPSYVYCVRRRCWAEALAFSEHSVFRRT